MKKWWVVLYSTKLFDDIAERIKKEKFNIKLYRPVVKYTEARKGLIKIIDKPLFFNYMFWYYDLQELPYTMLREYFQFRILKFNGIPQGLTNKQITKIKRSVQTIDGKSDRMRNDVKYLRRSIGWSVVVRDGVFTGLMGQVVDVRKTGMLVVELLVFNRPISCEMALEYVEFVKH